MHCCDLRSLESEQLCRHLVEQLSTNHRTGQLASQADSQASSLSAQLQRPTGQVASQLAPKMLLQNPERIRNESGMNPEQIGAPSWSASQ